MIVLIILNVVLISLVVFLVVYLLKSKGDVNESICENVKTNVEVKNINYKLNTKKSPERIFDGRFVTDEEYQQMKGRKRSDISILLEEVNNEYEHLKRLNNGGTERNNKG
jgi:hypothetical protein